MGADPNHIQQQIDEQRQRVGPRLTELRGRLRRDIEEAQSAARRRASQISRRTMQIVGMVTGGVVVGLITAVVIGRIRRQRRQQRRRDPAYWWGEARTRLGQFGNEARERFEQGRDEAQRRWADRQEYVRKAQREMQKRRRG